MYQQGWSKKDIAKATGQTIGLVRSKIFSQKMKLKTMFHKLGIQ